MLKAKKRVEGLIESSDTYLSQGNVQKARASLEDAKSTCEKHNLGSGVMSKINRRLGDINRAQGVANYKERRKSFSGASRRNSSVASAGRKDSSTASTVRMSSNFSSINTVSERMSKPSTSRLSAHDGSVNDEVFVDKASFFKQDERARASDACQESRRRSNIGSDRDISMMASAFGAVAKIKGCDFDNDELREVASEGLQKLAKKRKSQSKGELSEKPCNKSNDLTNELVSKKVTRKSLNPESSLDNTPARTGLDKSLSVSKHKRSPTYKVDNPVVVLGASCTTEQGQSSLNLQQDVCKLEEKSGDSIESERLVQPSFQHDPDAADMSDFDGLSTDKNSKRQLEECSISSIAKRGR